MDSERLFVALTLPAVVREEIAALSEPLDGVRWTPPDNLHLTLRFVGERSAEERTAMEDALARVRVEPFVLPVGGVGLFPSRGPAKVLWVGLGNAHTRLFQLRKQVDEALLTVDVGLDVHSFHPHITIARLGETHEPKELVKFLERHTRFEAPPFRVNEFQLMRSRLGEGPARYEVVRSFALQK
jgi:RNA 2',3'-cyclic 3'-phosphodiesterase